MFKDLSFEKFKLKVKFDKNKEIHKIDLEILMDTFLYYVTELWRGFEDKETAFKRLYERYTKIINKILKFDEIPNSKKYLFYYLLLQEEILNKKYYYFKNDENFKKVYEELAELILKSFEQDGYLTFEEFFVEIEKLKSRFKKELKEINKEVSELTYKTRRENYEKLQKFFVEKLNKK